MGIYNLRDQPKHTRYALESDAVYVGRPNPRLDSTLPGADGYFGNPFIMGVHGNRKECIRLFEIEARERITVDAEYRARVRGLYGKRLYCWCAPSPCHAEVLEQLVGELADAGMAESAWADG